MIQIDDFSNSPMGWICPKCGRVYSPNTSMCIYCGQESQTTWASTKTKDFDYNVYLNHNIMNEEQQCKTQI